MRTSCLSLLILCGASICLLFAGCASYTKEEEAQARAWGYLQRDLVIKQPSRIQVSGSTNYLKLSRDLDSSAESESAPHQERAIPPGARLRIDGLAKQFEIDPIPTEAYGHLFLPGEKPLPFRTFWITFDLFPWESKAEALRRIRQEKCAIPEGKWGDAAQRWESAKARALRRIEQSNAH